MDEIGIVSVWLGNFESQDELTSYAEARFNENGDSEAFSSFTQDFFNGDLWPFEPDFFDYAMTTASTDPAAVAEPLGEAVSAALVEQYPKGLDQSYNAIIAVYDYSFEGSRYVPGAPVRFIGALPYFKD